MNERKAQTSDRTIGSRLRRTAFFALRCTLLPFLMREVLRRRRPTIIVYHDLRAEVAEKHFRALSRSYNLISLAEYVGAVEDGRLGSLPPKSLVITLDDGHRANCELLPLFCRHRIRPAIFLCTGVLDSNRRFWWLHVQSEEERQRLKAVSDVERLQKLRLAGFEETKEFEERQALSRSEVEAMKGQVDFQSHTIFHPILSQCDEEKSRREITLSKERLEQGYELPIYALAFPNGDFSEREISLAREAGYRCALTLDDSPDWSGADLFRLRRICIPDDAGVSELLVKASGLWATLKRWLDTMRPHSGRELRSGNLGLRAKAAVERIDLAQRVLESTKKSAECPADRAGSLPQVKQ